MNQRNRKDRRRLLRCEFDNSTKDLKKQGLWNKLKQEKVKSPYLTKYKMVQKVI